MAKVGKKKVLKIEEVEVQILIAGEVRHSWWYESIHRSELKKLKDNLEKSHDTYRQQ